MNYNELLDHKIKLKTALDKIEWQLTDDDIILKTKLGRKYKTLMTELNYTDIAMGEIKQNV